MNVVSFGFKYGLPMEADLVFDVRFLPNPFYVEDLRPQTGLDEGVERYIFGFAQTGQYLEKVRDLLAFSLPLYAQEGKTGLTIAVGCTAAITARWRWPTRWRSLVRGRGYAVTENHRDIARG